MTLTDELRYKLLRAIEHDSTLSQRQLSKELGISLGKVNFCIKALLDIGLIQTSRFKNNHDKLAYSYVLTYEGVKEKKTRLLASYKANSQNIKALKLK